MSKPFAELVSDPLKMGADRVYFYPKRQLLRYRYRGLTNWEEKYINPNCLIEGTHTLKTGEFNDTIYCDYEQFVRTGRTWLKYHTRQTDNNIVSEFFGIYTLVNVLTFNRASDSLPYPAKTLDAISAFTNGLVIIGGPPNSGRTSTLMSLAVKLAQTGKEVLCLLQTPPIDLSGNTFSSGLINQVAICQTKKTSYFFDWPSDALLIDSVIKNGPELERLLTLAESKLVFILSDTLDPGSVINQIIYSQSRQDPLVRERLGRQLKAVLTQNILPAKYSHQGRPKISEQIAAGGIMIGTPNISQLIKEDKVYRLTSAIMTGHKYGMITFDEDLLNICKAGTITPETAIEYAFDVNSMTENLKSLNLSSAVPQKSS